jgi:hypothetical protein
MWLCVSAAAAAALLLLLLPRPHPRARKENIKLSVLFRQAYNVNVLSVARFFLFGSRDMWFEVPLPFFLRDAAHGFGWERVAVGAVLAVRRWPVRFM